MKWWDFKFYNFEPQANDVIFGTMVLYYKNNVNTYTVFPHIFSAETILFWIWKCKGHST